MEKAKQNKVTVFQSPFLARALYYTSDIGAEISDKLYTAVAIALAYIYRLDQGEDLIEPNIDLPGDLLFDEFGNKTIGV
jgi:flagellar biosynthetic protein FlhB